MDEAVLDDPDRLAAADHDGYLRALAGAGARVRITARAADEAGIGRLTADVRPRALVLVTSVGYAAAARVMVALEPTVPVIVATERLPSWIGPGDVVACLGADEPFLVSAAHAASARGAELLAIARDGSAVVEAGRAARGLVLPIEVDEPAYDVFWPVLTALVAATARLGLVDEVDVGAVADQLDEQAVRCRPDSEIFVNPAKSLAAQLIATLPLVWSTSRLAAVVGQRCADQLTAIGVPALHGHVADALLDQVGLVEQQQQAGDDIFRDRVDEPEAARPRIVLLRDEGEDAGRLAQAATAVAESRGVGLSEVAGEDVAPMLRLPQLIGVLDFAVAYEALVLGVDPAMITQRIGLTERGM